MQEKPIDELTVQEVLDRAGVGRSTFYLHYRDKDDLLLCVLEDGMEMWSTALARKKEKSLRGGSGYGILRARRKRRKI